jgi:hypothetical protein
MEGEFSFHLTTIISTHRLVKVLNGDVGDWMHRCMNYVGVELGCLYMYV